MILAMLSLAAAAGLGPKPIPPPVIPHSDMLVGAFYFPGWCAPERWYCMLANRQVLHPLLGYYREGDPEVADWHIKWAVEHGVGFFAFDYYSDHGSQMLESALDGFLQSRFVGDMKFCLNWCNHAPADTMTERQLADFADLVIPKYLKHPSYLWLDGKPLVIILSAYSFVKTLGVDGARKAFADFDRKCRKSGLPGAHIMSCEGEIIGEKAVRDSLAAGIRGFMLYNYPYAETGINGPGKYAEASYADMTRAGENLWKHWGYLTDGRFWPTVMPGWDRRPWLRDGDLVRTGSTPDLFKQALVRARDHINADRVVMVEAWNEWGEGSILEPSVEHRFGYLDAVRSVFSPDTTAHKDITPRDLQRPTPAYDLKLPSLAKWQFDFPSHGWSGSGVSDMRLDYGALVFRSVTGDAQISSPANYIECSKYKKARLRMKATGPSGGPVSARGQLFWSTVEFAMREDTSVSFDVALDGQWHVYELDLAAAPKWRGTCDGLRLDPVDAANVTVVIDELEFIQSPPPDQHTSH